MLFLLAVREGPQGHHIVYLADIVCSHDDNRFILGAPVSINFLNHTDALDDAMPMPLGRAPQDDGRGPCSPGQAPPSSLQESARAQSVFSLAAPEGASLFRSQKREQSAVGRTRDACSS